MLIFKSKNIRSQKFIAIQVTKIRQGEGKGGNKTE